MTWRFTGEVSVDCGFCCIYSASYSVSPVRVTVRVTVCLQCELQCIYSASYSVSTVRVKRRVAVDCGFLLYLFTVRVKRRVSVDCGFCCIYSAG